MADGSTPITKRKLIEISLPLEAINREAAREKSIRQGHPSTLHLWWARRPLAAARAVLFAQLVDDPSSYPDRFPTEELQRKERERLHAIIERLVVWENIRDRTLLAAAHEEILNSTDGNPPPILDPFAGGGTIPLEAQRLGLEAHASDLNPVAVLINKAMIEIPPKFRDRAPVFPGFAASQIRRWEGAEGLAADVGAYGGWMNDRAKEVIGDHYPSAKLPSGGRGSVVAWLWARSVSCPNPACGVHAPLVRSWWLSKKKGREAYVVPSVVSDPPPSSGKHVRFTIGHDPKVGPTSPNDGTMSNRVGATCVACMSAISLDYIKQEGVAGRIRPLLMAIVAESSRQRVYLPPDEGHEDAATMERPEDVPSAQLSTHPQYMGPPRYGMSTTADLFTNRQLVAIKTFCDLIEQAHALALSDALAAGFHESAGLEGGGDGARAYADAIATYLALGVSRMTDIANALCRWENTREQVRNLFGRQAIPMLWDFAETPPFGAAAGSFLVSLGNLAKAIADTRGPRAQVDQADASSRDYSGVLVSTDPPYYDNVPYADLSDFFYVWLRRMLRGVYPTLLATIMVPKAGELVADTQRHQGKDGAKHYFEAGFNSVFKQTRQAANCTDLMTVYYAFRQTVSDDLGVVSSGWETLLEGMIRAGWMITSTWPLRSELGNRMRSLGSNALASSIVLSLRPRPDGAQTIDRRAFIASLQAELPDALRRLQEGAIAPVDLPQAAIGPGMAVFSRYASVIEADGSPMSVRSALARINEILDQVLSEQEGDFDSVTRFAIAWYRQHGYGIGKFGDADSVARARNTSVETMDRSGVLTSRAGNVALIKPGETPTDYDVVADAHVSTWEALHHLGRLADTGGVAACGTFLARAASRPDAAIDPDLVKELAFLLFSIAEKNGWTKDALVFNALATAWADIVDASAAPRHVDEQPSFDFDEDA